MKWKFKKNAEPQGSSNGFWYDINNGYIDLTEVLSNKQQIQDAQNAINLLNSLETALEKAELLNEF